MADIVFTGQTPDAPSINSSAMPKNHDMVIYKGDYVEFYLSIKDSSNTAINITGYTPKAQLKTGYDDWAPIDFTCTLSNPTGGIVKVYLSSGITSSLLPGSYIWDFQLTNTSSDVRTYIAGDVTVYDEVTQ